MLTGKELGKAIALAIQRKIESGHAKSKAEIARHFKIKPPGIYDWIKKGSISKDKLPELWRYFSDVVGPEHWGLSSQDIFASPPQAAAGSLEPDGGVAPELTEDQKRALAYLAGLTPSQRAEWFRWAEAREIENQEVLNHHQRITRNTQ